jgi:hypothetical protein
MRRSDMRGQCGTFSPRSLRFDPESLVDWYRALLGLPWARWYTLNVDDLALAASRAFDLPRRIVTISATAGLVTAADSDQVQADVLQVVHLNGTLADIPHAVTFSNTQYHERLARHEPWYQRLAVDLLTHPFVFIGTRLEEPPLWQHVVLRGPRGGRGLREMRHRSYLVTPTLFRARQALLTEFNVHWVPMTAEQFATTVVPQLSAAAGVGLDLLRRRAQPAEVLRLVPEVADLATKPNQSSEFLLGEEPIWADIQSDRASVRECDEKLFELVERVRRQTERRGYVLVTGTAGSGKSTSLMRVCLRLSAEGVRVAWVDRDLDLSPRELRRTMFGDRPPAVLAIDDADVYGPVLAPLVREIACDANAPLVLLAVRSGRVDNVLNPTQLDEVPGAELAMPPLCDQDINGLLDVLTRENRLGILTGRPRTEQLRAFRDKAGRQLIVAMIEATSGRPFREKLLDELLELKSEEQIWPGGACSFC